eukprot:TRINITY_DN28168_c0_g1_i1.p1 TRINITY_DN28168_c0_g1~~TRINITY_DN28168_c0_g1_i1.p1  ORF type:complete len:328 (-),score=55.57 TRINITY_DN28168_c0_g1_i1:46-1029(-)
MRSKSCSRIDLLLFVYALCNIMGPYNVDAFSSPETTLLQRTVHVSSLATTGFRLSMYQGPAVNGNVTANLEQLATQATNAAANGTNLIMFPEVFLSGYSNFSIDEIYSMAEVNDGPAFQFVSKTAQMLNISILYGYIEQDANNATALYDAAQLVDNNGKALLNHRKVQLSGAGEKMVFTPGLSFGPVVELYGVKIGVLICYEVSVPEATRALALQVVLIPTAQAAPPELNIYSTHQVPTRASENLVHVAYANYAQSGGLFTFYGLSRIADPYGATLAVGPAGSDESAVGLVTADIDPRAYLPSCVLLGDRLPDRYSDLCAANAYCLG